MKKACPACKEINSTQFINNPVYMEYFVKRKSKVTVVICLNCKAIYQDPFPKTAELEKLYPLDYQNYNKKSTPILSDLLNLLNNLNAKSFIKKFGKNKTVLDYGCGDGSFIKCPNKNDLKKIYGFDPNIRENNQINEKESCIIHKYKNLKKIGRFDIIRMHHVIEHLSDLDNEMLFLKSLLKKNGLILIQTPNPLSISLKLFKRFWGPLHYPYHTILFTPESLKIASKRWELNLSSLAPSRIMPTGWSMSAENLIKNKFRIKIRGRTPIYSLLSISLLPISFLETIIFQNSSPIMNYVLMKND